MDDLTAWRCNDNILRHNRRACEVHDDVDVTVGGLVTSSRRDEECREPADLLDHSSRSEWEDPEALLVGPSTSFLLSSHPPAIPPWCIHSINETTRDYGSFP